MGQRDLFAICAMVKDKNMKCTCPYVQKCWHGDTCGTQMTIIDIPVCFRDTRLNKKETNKKREMILARNVIIKK